MQRFRIASFLLLLLAFNCTAQVNRVRLSVTNPANGKEENLRVAALSTTSEVTGNRVITTYALTFANPFKRQLEGVLHFALGNGENVIRFALEINGKMREGVVVDKNKGQKVFEEIIRRRVDPGLLEKTEGNNYRARVFPIPAEGTKQLIIACESVIAVPYKQAMPVTVPLNLGEKVDQFNLRMVVNNSGAQPELQGNDKIKTRFEKEQQRWVAECSYNNISLNTTLRYDVPVPAGPQVFLQQQPDGKGYFFSATVFLPEVKSEKREPETLAIVWDNSLSGLRRDKKQELDLIKNYISSLRKVQVNVYTSNIQMSAAQGFPVSGGNCNALLSYLQNITCDGATQLGAIDLTTIKADEILLVTDGISNYGDAEIRYGETPVYSIVTSPSANYAYLDFVSAVTGGKLIIASPGSDIAAAQKSLRQLPLRLQRYSANENVSEVYYDLAVTPGYGFTISGLCDKPQTTLQLVFGNGGKTEQSAQVSLGSETEIRGSTAVERTWAIQKMNRLLLLPEKNKAAVIKHSTTYNVVSPFTSLLVLDDINDYVRYEVEPPAELKAQYMVKRDSMRASVQKEKKDRIETVYAIYKKKKDWWETDYFNAIADINVQKRVAEENKKWELKLEEKQKQIDSLQFIYEKALVTIEQRDRSIDSLKRIISGIKWRSDSLKNPVKYQREYIEKDKLLKSKKSESAKMLETVQFTEPLIDADARGSFSISTGEAYNLGFSSGGVPASFGDATGGVVNIGNISADSALVAVPGAMRAGANGKTKAITLDDWKSDAPYIKAMEHVKDDSLYTVYLRLRKDYLNMAPFYMDMGELFAKKGKTELANRIFSNVVELGNQDFAMMRVLGNRLLQAGEVETSVKMFEQVLKLRPEEPQSYRDLGLALARSRKYQAAIDTLYNVITGEWNDRFPEIESIVITEINNIIATCGEPLSLAKIDSRFLLNMTAATRVVVCWDTDNCDLDLWVTEPTKEKCVYNHALTNIGGRLSRDFTRGYGPEEYMLHYPLDGDYKIELNYYGQSATTILGPTTITVQIYTDYGKPTQKLREVTRRVSTAKEVIQIGNVAVGD
jgi:tetratricopeptide (TPR) repeat protein